VKRFGQDFAFLTSYATKRYGKVLLQAYADFKAADVEIRERVVRVESTWMKICTQIRVLQSVWNTLREEHQNNQDETLQILISKLSKAIKRLESVQRRGGPTSDRVIGVKKWKYALVKESLDKTIDDLETWQGVFDPSWFLLISLASPTIDQELDKEDMNSKFASTAKRLRKVLKNDNQNSSVFLPDDGLDAASKINIAFSTAHIVYRPSWNRWLILDSVACHPETNKLMLTEDVRDLARKLGRADPFTFGLLSCLGAIKVLDPNDEKRITSFDFVFNIPDGMKNPRSLRELLLIDSVTTYSLSDRFKIAKQLATSVSYVHTFGFVHKNIRPETILIFRDEKAALGFSFLLGFERFRLAVGQTLQTGDSDWHKNLYRHPQRQGLKPEEVYVMQHDIYSLGVCLLEIGLWESLVTYDSVLGPHLMAKCLKAETEPADAEVSEASVVKDSLVQLARKQLPSRMGDKYADIVLNCLTCLDTDNQDFGDAREFEDSDGVLVAVRYIEKVSKHHLQPGRDGTDQADTAST
jgi:hypothetical protein